MGRAAKRKWMKRRERIRQLEASVYPANQQEAKLLRVAFGKKLGRKTT